LPTWRLVHSRDTQDRSEMNVSFLQKKACNILEERCDATRLPLTCPGVVRCHDWINRCSITGFVGARWEPSKWCRSKKKLAPRLHIQLEPTVRIQLPLFTEWQWVTKKTLQSAIQEEVLHSQERTQSLARLLLVRSNRHAFHGLEEIFRWGWEVYPLRKRNSLKSRRIWWEEERRFSVDTKGFGRARFRVHLTNSVGWSAIPVSVWRGQLEYPASSSSRAEEIMSVSHLVGYGSETFATVSAQPIDFKRTSFKRGLL
jgi:hypothetical protein